MTAWHLAGLSQICKTVLCQVCSFFGGCRDDGIYGTRHKKRWHQYPGSASVPTYLQSEKDGIGVVSGLTS